MRTLNWVACIPGNAFRQKLRAYFIILDKCRISKLPELPIPKTIKCRVQRRKTMEIRTKEGRLRSYYNIKYTTISPNCCYTGPATYSLAPQTSISDSEPGLGRSASTATG